MLKWLHIAPFIVFFVFLIMTGVLTISALEPGRIAGDCVGVFCDGLPKIIVIFVVLGIFYFIFIKVLRG